jgi:hypothetical protein
MLYVFDTRTQKVWSEDSVQKKTTAKNFKHSKGMFVRRTRLTLRRLSDEGI